MTFLEMLLNYHLTPEVLVGIFSQHFIFKEMIGS